MIVNGYGLAFGGDKNILKSTVMMIATLYTYTKNHYISTLNE